MIEFAFFAAEFAGYVAAFGIISLIIALVYFILFKFVKFIFAIF